VFLYRKTVTWRIYIRIIYLVITTEGKEAEYAPLTNLFRALSVGDLAAYAVNAICPVLPPQSATLARDYDKMAKRLFPALHTAGSAGSTAQQNPPGLASLPPLRTRGSNHSAWRRRKTRPLR
jgi:hypothetical protein